MSDDINDGSNDDINDDINDERWKVGAEKLADVYQGMVAVVPPGLMDFSDIMTRDLFGGIWTRDQLDVGQRRLIVMGVIAAVGGPNTWKLQCKSALKRGELTEQQVREVLIQATPYVGYPRAAELVGVTEEAISECRREAAEAGADTGDEAKLMAAITAPGDWSFGVQLPIQTLTRTLVDPWEDEATVDDLVAVAQRCDEGGYDFVGVCDHVAIPDNEYAARMTTTWYDTVATLSFLAAHTRNVRLLSVVWIAAYRHPLQTAKSFGTLDHLSGGRAILGVGAGHVEAEFEALGVDFSTRGKRLDETLDAVRAAFSDTYVSHHGEMYSYSDVGVAPQPAAELPIWVGGMGKAAWRRTGRIGDGYIPMGNAKDQYPEILETIATTAESAGRSGVGCDVGYMPPWTYLLGDVPEGVMALSGGTEALAQDIRAARQVGANTFHLKFRARDVPEYLEQVDAFVEEVVPMVNEA